MKELQPKSDKRIEWEMDVCYQLEVREELTTSDAQGFMEAHKELTDQCYEQYLSAEDTAIKLFETVEAEMADDQEDDPEYWNKIYTGKNDNAAQDASNTKRPPNPFDRFSWVAAHAEGTAILGIASGHAHIEKIIKAKHPDWNIIASDQAADAEKVANFKPYKVINAYKIPYIDKSFKTIICTQAMEYMDDQERFLLEAQRVADVLLITVPIGEMAKWSQLRIYTEENVRALLEPLGTIEIFEREGDLLLVKLRFND